MSGIILLSSKIKFCKFCGKKAYYKFKNGKWCCESHPQKCSFNKEKMKGENNHFYGHQHSKESKTKMSNSRKGLLVGSRNGMHKSNRSVNPFCGKFHTKEQKLKWKIERSTFEYRKNMSLLMKKLWEEQWFRSTHVKYQDSELPKVKNYYRDVWRITRNSYNNYKNIINPKNKKLEYYGYHLDHIYSIINGYDNHIPPYIIGSYVNLQLLWCKDNIKKRKKSWISLDELFNKYEASKYENNF